MIVDNDCNILDANIEMASMCGVCRNDLLDYRIDNFHMFCGVDTESESMRQLEIVRKQKISDRPMVFSRALQYCAENDVGEVKLSDDHIVELKVAPIHWDGKDVYLFTLHDITVRNKFMNQLTDSNDELERFAYVCSHDLQEPLRMIRSFSEKLQIYFSNENIESSKANRYLDFIADGAERAQLLISDILAYSRINSSTRKMEPVNTMDMVDRIKTDINSASDDSAVMITYENLPVVQGDPTQLRQLFQNLINNAMKYHRVENPPRIQLSAEAVGHFWQFSIKDNGLGIESRHLFKIFDVFQRLHRQSAYAGTGIGLSICKNVVERHGGSIWVDSEYGVGSSFHFTLLKNL